MALAPNLRRGMPGELMAGARGDRQDSAKPTPYYLGELLVLCAIRASHGSVTSADAGRPSCLGYRAEQPVCSEPHHIRRSCHYVRLV